MLFDVWPQSKCLLRPAIKDSLVEQLRAGGIESQGMFPLFPKGTIGVGHFDPPKDAVRLPASGRWHAPLPALSSGTWKLLFIGENGPALVRIALDHAREQVRAFSMLSSLKLHSRPPAP